MDKLKKFIKKWGASGIKESLRRKKKRRETRKKLERSLVSREYREKLLEKYILNQSPLEAYLMARFLSAQPSQCRASFYKEKEKHDPNQKFSTKAIAFYLPQFHPIKENNEWWGEGFTEWTNVTKAQPQFIGHHQPQLPADLGFYDLRLPETLRQQRDLAKNYGISGFCFHYYWFSQKRLLETPINNFIKDKSLDMDFCFCWANENWTRRWDGRDNEILISQEFSESDDIKIIDDLIESFKDPRYIKIKSKPLLIVYRASLLPDAKATAMRWRQRVKENGFSGIYLVCARSNHDIDPRDFGFDAAVEFPPHQVDGIDISDQLPAINPNYAGHVQDYAEVAERFGKHDEAEYRLFKTVMPAWDNEARKPGKGLCFHGSTPDLYSKWLRDAIEISNNRPSDERIVFINAWNEWAEGAHLEPDTYSGHAYLEATRKVLEETTKPDND